MEFVYQGKGYTSMAEFCRKHNISYAKLCRIRRKYKKALYDIKFALDVLTSRVDVQGEELSHIYKRDMIKSKTRYLKFLENQELRVLKKSRTFLK